MKQLATTLIVVLAFVPRSARATQSSVDTQLANIYFQEATEICARDGGKLWGISLCGPMLFVDPATREVVANQPDSQVDSGQHN